MSFSLHSSTENFGGGRRSWSVGSNSRISLSDPEKSSIGLMSLKVSASPSSRNHLNESRWIEMRSGSGRTSSRLANEKRSLDAERVGKAYSWGRSDEGKAVKARRIRVEEAVDACEDTTAKPSVGRRANKGKNSCRAA